MQESIRIPIKKSLEKHFIQAAALKKVKTDRVLLGIKAGWQRNAIINNIFFDEMITPGYFFYMCSGSGGQCFFYDAPLPMINKN